MKVYTKVVFNMEDCSVVDEESYDYEGPMAECKGQGNTTTTTRADPWGPTQPYWNQIMQGIQGTPATPGTPARGRFGYQGTPATAATPGLLQNQLANVNPYQQQAWDMTAANAGNTANTSLLTGSRDYANRVLGGEFLDPTKNLNLAQNLQEGMAGLGSWDQAASQAGRYGSDTWATGRGQELGKLRGDLYGQGLQQMTQMAGMAPEIYNAQYLPSQYLNALGQEQEQRPWNLYGRASSLLQAPNGGSTSTSTPYYGASPLQGLMGLGLTGAGFATGNPMLVASGAGATSQYAGGK